MDEGFKKINFDTDPAMAGSSDSKPSSKPQDPSLKPKTESLRTPLKINFAKFFSLKRLGITGVVLLLLGALILYVAVRAFAVYSKTDKVYDQAKKAVDAAKNQNIILARAELVKTREAAEGLKRELGSIAFAKFIPGVGLYISDADHMVGAGIHGINAAIITADSLIPYADVLGLKGKGTFAGGSAEERIRTAVRSLGKVVPKIDDIEVEVKKAKKEINYVNPARYPRIGPLKKIHNQIASLKTLVDNGVLAVEQGKPLIKVLPDLLGSTKSKKYLILFQNDGELRPTGGFLTYYSIFRVEEGVIHVDSSNDIYRLDDSIRLHPAAPDIIRNYFPKVTRFYIRDSNLSPDFQESMKTFREFYETSRVKAEIDGIIAIDTEFLVNVIKILGEVKAGGQFFKAENDPRCNCPQVVYQLQTIITTPVGYIREDRKGIIAELLYAIMQKALGVSPGKYWGPLFQQAIIDANEKHILFSVNNAGAQKGLDALNWAGRIKSFEGDYLHINDANFSGAKTNMFIKQNGRIDYEIGSDGAITKTVTMEYRNPEKHSDCNLERGGLCLNAIHRDFQRVYVPKGSTLVSNKGSQVKVGTHEDKVLSKTYFEGFFTLNPLGKSSMIYKYKLPFRVEKGVLPVMIQKQGGVEVVPMEIYVNGKKVETFDLRSDKVLNLKI
ncbi:MAG: hypothetical protein A2868_03370 [Candidatus Levybacteria bacterium RIFCSPHIGHO2_01_FULL_40_15b]|nr:MAG: hypothetical protein A2868_03370 [Candidatus Levybacteria bacterium RIFCSPHIGHO2_01_FULL_40_15b]